MTSPFYFGKHQDQIHEIVQPIDPVSININFIPNSYRNYIKFLRVLVLHLCKLKKINIYIQWNLSNPTHHDGTREMCRNNQVLFQSPEILWDQIILSDVTGCWKTQVSDCTQVPLYIYIYIYIYISYKIFKEFYIYVLKFLYIFFLNKYIYIHYSAHFLLASKIICSFIGVISLYLYKILTR